MNHVLLVRYGEIHLKGLNRPHFESLLKKAMERALKGLEGVKVTKGEGRYYVTGFAEKDMPQVTDKLTRVFGIHSISPAIVCEKDLSTIYQLSCQLCQEYLNAHSIKNATFKVAARRSDKRFAMKSMELAREAGAQILDNVPGLLVDVHHPDFMVNIEVREQVYLYVDSIPGQGGMPLGSSSKAMVLLSGGIDSPVSAFMIARRGVVLEAIHFHSFPYTSEKAKQKVIDLAGILSEYCGPIKLHVVNFTEIQMEIHEKCPPEELVIIMRRIMMRIAQRIAQREGAKALVTGESIGQVASQTMDSLYVTNSVVQIPVFRPLIGMDKQEIMEKAMKIGTYETSILPYEDCCTVFVPKHPVTRPKLERIEASEMNLDIDALVEKALEDIEVIWASGKQIP